MRHQRITLTATFAAILGSAATAEAQIGVYNRPQVNPRPTVSPYLNIFRGNAAANYYGVVRPQMEMNRQLFQLQQEVQQIQPTMMVPFDQQQQQLLGGMGLMTGHSVSFQNYSHFYGNRVGGTGGIAGGSGGPTGIPNLGAAPIRPIITTPIVQQ